MADLGRAPRTDRPAPRMGPRELLAFLGLSTSLVALGIDVMLPAYDEIRAGLDLDPDSTAVTGLVTTYFFGMAFGTLLYGPVADRYGRRRTLQIGLLVYMVGALATAMSPSISVMFAARFLWGFGAAGPRTVAMAVVRDRFEGDAMSRAMSTLMAIFMIVPIVAPSIGAAALNVLSFRGVFAACAAVAVLVFVWGLRLVESLRPEDQLTSLTFGPVRESARTVLSNREAVFYTLGIVCMFGAFLSYVGTSELIFADVLGQEETFPLWFGATAATMAVAALTGKRIVTRLGMPRTIFWAQRSYMSAVAVGLGVAVVTGGVPPVLLFAVIIGVTAASQAILIPNLNTAAMAPLGRVAGMASSLIGAAQTFGGTILAAMLDRTFNQTVTPLFLGFVAAGIGMNLCITAARRSAQEEPAVAVATAPGG